MENISALQKNRLGYKPKLPPLFSEHGMSVRAMEGLVPETSGDGAALAKQFPRTGSLPLVSFGAEPGRRLSKPLVCGVVLSGGQAPGGHNVIAGLFDALQASDPGSKLFGFLGGPGGILENRHRLLDRETVDRYRNTGGFDMIQSGRTKLEEEEQFRRVAETCQSLGVDSLVVIGGDDSNTNACLLAEFFLREGIPVKVVGVPKTIDGDLKNERMESSFGFDTATKIYSELVGNIERDADSARKYWHFIRVMGRSASHIALECALQCRPNIAIISEEVAARSIRLVELCDYLAGVVRNRSELGMDFGVAVIPEGLVEFIPEIKKLIAELNDILARDRDQYQALPTDEDRQQFLARKLSAESAQTFSVLPQSIRSQLLEDRDPHGNVQVSKIETEKLLGDMVGDRLRELARKGMYKGKFSAQYHFFGYEGRCAPPSNFDADYAYSLGYTAAALLASGRTGYMAVVRNLARPADQWAPGGVPLASMMALERRKGREVPVIRKALVDLESRPFLEFAKNRERWALNNEYLYPGPIQYYGPSEVCDRRTKVLELEYGQSLARTLAGTNLLKDPSFLDSLSLEEMARFIEVGQHMSVDMGWVVIRRGEEGRAFYVVIEGELEVLGPDDRTVIATLGKGDAFGEIALLTDSPRTATVVAKTECQLLMLEKQGFLEFIAEHGPIEEHLCKLCIKRMEEQEAQKGKSGS